MKIKLLFIIFLTILLALSLVSAFGYTTKNIPGPPINYSLIPSVNSSDFWDNLDTPLDIDLNDLGDVNAPTPNDNDTLTWDDATSKWIAEAIGAISRWLIDPNQNYITNTSTTLSFNETKLNETIDARAVTTESDPIFSANFTNMQTDCPAGNYSYGVEGNGTFKCRSDLLGAGMDYTNVVLTNQSNTYSSSKIQNFNDNTLKHIAFLGLGQNALGKQMYLYGEVSEFDDDYVLEFDLNGANRVLNFINDYVVTLADWFDQNVKTTASPTFSRLNIVNDINTTSINTTSLSTDSNENIAFDVVRHTIASYDEDNDYFFEEWTKATPEEIVSLDLIIWKSADNVTYDVSDYYDSYPEVFDIEVKISTDEEEELYVTSDEDYWVEGDVVTIFIVYEA